MAMVTKPALRGLGRKAWTTYLAISIAIAGSFAVWAKTYVVEARKKQYIEFYENYDDEKEFEAMRKAGIFKGFESG